ncbi:hypothetical protein SM191_02590 [Sphingomonas sp. 2378]
MDGDPCRRAIGMPEPKHNGLYHQRIPFSDLTHEKYGILICIMERVLRLFVDLVDGISGGAQLALP